MPDKVLNGLDLIWHSDLVISGGGTMNREAAAMGVPVYSIFRGKLGAVDRYLSETGRLSLIQSRADVSAKIKVAKRQQRASPEPSPALSEIVATIEHLLLAA
jgi:predicted glycosyltransferase